MKEFRVYPLRNGWQRAIKINSDLSPDNTFRLNWLLNRPGIKAFAEDFSPILHFPSHKTASSLHCLPISNNELHHGNPILTKSLFRKI